MAHFVEATMGKEALTYGSPVVLINESLGIGYRPLAQRCLAITVISAAICIVIMLGNRDGCRSLMESTCPRSGYLLRWKMALFSRLC